MKTVHVYGIKNCNTVKKALTWLETKQIPFEFHDFKKEDVDHERLRAWADKMSWEALVNKKGTTWRKLTPEEQSDIRDLPAAVEALRTNTSMIKRPVVEIDNVEILLGFDEAKYEQAFQKV